MNSPDRLFRDVPQELVDLPNIPASERYEYVKLVAKQIQNGKLCLSESVHAEGGVLTVSKRHKSDDSKEDLGPSRLREVWNGHAGTTACVSPPKPPCLADVTFLSHIALDGDQRLRVSKHDVTCCFDQLRLPRDSCQQS